MTVLIVNPTNRSSFDKLASALTQYARGCTINEMTGVVTYRYSPDLRVEPFDYRLYTLVASNVSLAVIGAGPDLPIPNMEGGATTLGQNGGGYFVAAGNSLEIYLDITNCNGTGYHFDTNEGRKEGRLDIYLAHELSHAYHYLAGNTISHSVIINDENFYRNSRSLPIRTSEEGYSNCQDSPGDSVDLSLINDDSGNEGGLWLYTEEYLNPDAALRFFLDYKAWPPFDFEAKLRYTQGADKWYERKAIKGGTPPKAQPIRLEEALLRLWVPQWMLAIREEVMLANVTYDAPNEGNFNPQSGSSSDCLVAESFPGGSDASELQALRSLRQNVLLRTHWGERAFSTFHQHYYSFSPAVSKLLAKDSDMRGSIGMMIAQPLVNYLRLVALAPRLDSGQLRSLPATWRPLVQRFAEDLRDWVASIGFGEMSVVDAEPEALCIEIALALRLKFMNESERMAYLEDLGRRALIPIGVDGPEVYRLRAIMAQLGATDTEMNLVVRDRQDA